MFRLVRLLSHQEHYIMEKVTPLGTRKSDHIRINLEQNIQSDLTTGLELYHFIHCAIPEVNLEDIDTSASLFGKKLKAPILISSMTGGTEDAARINQNLATAAQETQIAMGVGSQRIAIEHPDSTSSFSLRSFAPDILLFANLGAIQLNYGYGVKECQQAVDMIEADALILHFNCLQEAIQDEGETKFGGLINRVEAICKLLPVPVIAKEVGWGFSKQDVTRLIQAGVSSIDVAGAGGTSWAQVEMHRSKNEHRRILAKSFSDWGIPTSEAIRNVIEVSPTIPIIASGGLRSGVEIAKCIALGATIGGIAGPFLKAAVQSVDETIEMINIYKDEITLCMFATGSTNSEELRQNKLVKT
jgi:isopentenyl-diphosphate delta-isomerase